jgi:hypothetical protein
VNLTSPAGSGSITAYAWDFYRTAGDNSAVTTSNKENVLTFGLSGGWPLGRTVQLQPLAEARFWSPDEGSGQLYGAGAACALRYPLGSSSLPVVDSILDRSNSWGHPTR